MTRADLAALAALLSERIGLAIDQGKQQAIETRLQPALAAHGLPGVGELLQRLSTGGDPALLTRTIDAMVTCETLFFRDRKPFEALRAAILPQLREARRAERRIRIWSAACATGQEPYSLAMLIDEQQREFSGWRVDLMASDVSEAAVAAAREGRYSGFEVQRGLPTPLLLRHFQRDGEAWRINDHLRARVDFRRANLIDEFGRFGRFDIIFCRNVLMYMDVERRRDILRRLARALADDGYLALGAAETVVGLSDEFEPAPDCAGLFRRSVRPRLRLAANS